ncbi:hypothetical protein LBMAG33_1620 [Candidatus Levyibacteriota bacterium]|nr:hypothetical protein [Candidatus Levybacteria bacterium]GDX61852.1 hypothetical protein LBMAG33_1620 [Candidatus Levybacteria bacterium]
MDKKKNAPAYQVNLSAVKKIQKKNKGIDITRHVNPVIVVNFELFLINNTKKMIKNKIS